MSRRNSRTGLKRPREMEKVLLEALWRNRHVGADPREPSKADIVFSELIESSPRTPHWSDSPDKLNEFAETLRLLGLTYDEPGFREAFLALKRLGLTGGGLGDMLQREDEFQSMKLTGLPLVKPMVEAELADGATLEQALERTAAKLDLPSSSFDGAVQAVKRVWLAEKSGDAAAIERAWQQFAPTTRRRIA